MLGKSRLTNLNVLPIVGLSALLLIATFSSQAQTETALYNFTGGSDGAFPQSGLTPDGVGNFYGTTFEGGLGYGTVFELSPNGSGGWNETVLHSFTGGVDGKYPQGTLFFDSAGNLYGTTTYGGGSGCDYGCGIVFELSPSSPNWTETVLYSFTGNGDGALPLNGVILDPSGNIYGATEFGIGGCAPGGSCGTIFELNPTPSGGWSEQVLYVLDYYNGSSPGLPLAGLIMDTKGSIFAVTTSAVIELSPTGGSWTGTVIHTFNGPKDGNGGAMGTPVFDKAGNLYGTTEFGGPRNYGMIYELSPGKNGGAWTERVLHLFSPCLQDWRWKLSLWRGCIRSVWKPLWHYLLGAVSMAPAQFSS